MERLPTTVLWSGRNFLSRLGPKLEDWEPVLYPEDFGIDEYDRVKIGKFKR